MRTCGQYLVFGLIVLCLFVLGIFQFEINWSPSWTNLILKRGSSRPAFRNRSLDGSTEITQRLPKAIIIGASKCGTDALRRFLTINPHIVTAKGDINFFNKDRKFRQGLDYYRHRMPPSRPDQLTLEKSIAFGSARDGVAAERIKAYNATIRLLVIVRDPVKRVISLIAHHRAHGGRSFGRSYENILLDNYNHSLSLGRPIIKNSNYYQAMRTWLRYFSSEQILVVDGQSYIEDPLPWLQEAERFLGLPSKITKDDILLDEKKGFYCYLVNGTKECMARGKGRAHEPVPEWILKKMYDYYTPLNERFFQLIRQKFNWKPLTEMDMREKPTFAKVNKPG